MGEKTNFFAISVQNLPVLNDFTFLQAAPPETDKQHVDNKQFHGSLTFFLISANPKWDMVPG